MSANRFDAARSLLSDIKSGRLSALPVTDLMLTLLGVLYLISPVDFLPEVALGPLGLLDDTGVLALIIAKLTMMLDRRAAAMNATNMGAGQFNDPRYPAGSPAGFPGDYPTGQAARPNPSRPRYISGEVVR